MPITIIPDTGVNNIYVNADTGRNIILSGIGITGENLFISGIETPTPHNQLAGLQGGQAGQYYHLTADEYSNLNTGIDSSQFYLASNPSGFITGVDLSAYVTGDVVRPSDTGQFYPTSNPSGYITGVNQVSFSTLLPTGIEETGISFPYSFASTPRVFAELLLNSDTGYYVGVKNASLTGYTALFSDIIEETGIYLQTFVNL